MRWGGLTGAFIAGYTDIDGYAIGVLLISPILVDYVGNALRMVPLSHVAPARKVSMRFAAGVVALALG